MNELVSEESTVSKDLSGTSFSDPPLEGVSPHSPPVDATSPPSYADIARKKNGASSSSSDDDSFEQFFKKIGRKSKKEIREEEAERLKTQGSQATIEIANGRNKRNRPPKGVISPSPLGK